MAFFSRRRAQRSAVAVVFVLSSAVGFLPLFGGPGYEQSLASGLMIPSAAAIAASLDLSADPGVTPLGEVAQGLASGALLAAVALLVALLHALRVGACDLGGGVVFFFLTAGAGALLGGMWGAVVAELARTRRRRRLVCVALSLALPLVGIAVSVARFYATPIIFAYDPFFGYFSGALYDTVIDVRSELLVYRAGTAAMIAGVALVAAGLRRTEHGSLALGGPGGRGRAIACVLLGSSAVLASLVVGMSGPEVGTWQTAATIGRALGGRAAGRRCDVVYPDSLSGDEVTLLVRDCDEELSLDEARLGARLPGRLTEYVFADARQKRRLMGAGQTSIAKPWRREVYVQREPYPHPLLGHEIAHVVAGSFAPGPLHVGGGLWPNPGLIEGVAVATSPDDDQLTDAQWARAMLDLGILPSPSAVFSLGFLSNSAPMSYTVAGAFVSWVSSRWGTSVVRTWYGGGSIERLTGQSWAALGDLFRAWLQTLRMPPQATSYARARFARPSVWQRRCPHVVDAVVGQADECRDERRFVAALRLYDAALSVDADDWRARFDRAVLRLRGAAPSSGRSELASIAANERAPKTWRDRSLVAIADDDLAHDRVAEAVNAYRTVADETLDEDVARTLEVKILAAADPLSRRVVVDLLIAEPRVPVDHAWTVAATLGVWAEGTRSPLAEYLLGKNLSLHGDWALAAQWLDRALDGDVPSARIAREVLRTRAICACALEDRSGIARVRRLLGAPESPFREGPDGRREWIVALMSRCERDELGEGS
ncbi:MAG TPA: hypothetical protein VEK07_16270 [Polyangiaceae bacterium]|nr:hypothetical protein [Polyangiaceae bacterium]